MGCDTVMSGNVERCREMSRWVGRRRRKEKEKEKGRKGKKKIA